MNTSGIEISEDGSILVHESEADRDRKDRKKRLEVIRELITEESYSPSEIAKLIAIEVARVTEDLSECIGSSGTDSLKLKVLEQKLKALRELGKQVSESYYLANKDELNLDGEKFKYVLSEIINYFLKALKDSGISEDVRNSILKNYRDEMSVNESQIRVQLRKMDNKR